MGKPQSAASENNQSVSKRGGKRTGAGRKPGSSTQKTRQIADAVAATGLTPLEVMVEAMLSYRDAGELDKAASIAKDAAPYIHPRLASIEHGGKGRNGEILHQVEFVIVDAQD